MMTAGDMLRMIMGYFGQSKNYPEGLITYLQRACDNIDEEERERVMERLREEHESTRILSVKNLAETCRGLGVSWRSRKQTSMAESEDVVCGCCEIPYRWKPSATDVERIEDNVHATCPKCGWPHSDELRYKAYCGMGMEPDAAYHVTYKQQTEWLLKQHVGADKPPAWSREKARREIEEQKRARIDRMMHMPEGKTIRGMA